MYGHASAIMHEHVCAIAAVHVCKQVCHRRSVCLGLVCTVNAFDSILYSTTSMALCALVSLYMMWCVCVQPETVAAYLVPRVRTVVARKAMSTYIKYLTIPRALVKFMSAPTKANKYFSKQGTHPA